MIVGIDLGTTNSAVAAFVDGHAVLIPNRLEQILTPSAVSLIDGKVTVGLAARERQATHPLHTATAFKRYMGTQKRFALDGQEFSPEDLSSLVLRSLKEDAEVFLGQSVNEAVITVPAYFNDKQRKATRRAGELAGMKVERLLNEPTAAALAYGIHRLDAESRFLVFDLGGGTFDVSVLEIFDGIIEVRASTGDNRLGGEDFNELIIDLLCEEHRAGLGAWAKTDVKLYQVLREQAERARRELTSQASTTINIVWRNKTYATTITTEDFEKRAEGLIRRLRDPVLRSLRDTNIQRESLDEIVLIGGSTRMPVIRKAVARMFGRFPNSSVNPDEAVALGAAVQAGLKARDAALSEVVVTDVAPFSMGISHARDLPGGGLEHGVFAPIIERNMTIPVSRIRSFSTLQHNQRQVDMEIYQGEARMAVDNVKIGDLRVPVPRAPAGLQIDCRFSYDMNGLLEVDVTIPLSGDSYQLVITDPDAEIDAASLAEQRAKLAALKVHPRDSEPNRAALARAERCWESALGEKRELVDAWIAEFHAALATQDSRVSERARVALLESLDQFEGHSFL